MPAAVTRKPPASGVRTPAWSIRWLATCTPTPIAAAKGRKASPVASAPVLRTSCRYSEESKKAPNIRADAASIMAKPPPMARSRSQACGRGPRRWPGRAAAEHAEEARRSAARAREEEPGEREDDDESGDD